MSQYPQEPPQELPSPFWSAHARPQETETPLTVLPPRDLFKRENLRTVQGIRELAKYRHPSCIPALVQAMASNDLHLCIAAGKALHDYGEAALPPIAKAALEGRGRLREQAVIWLGDCGDLRATAVLLEVIQKERKERFLRNIGLGTLSVVLSLLFQGWINLTNWDTAVRERAAESLGRLGDVRAIAPLAKMARSASPEVAGAAFLALSQLLPLLASMRMEQAGTLPPDTIPAITNLLDPRLSTLVRHALAALYAVGDGSALPAVKRLAEYRTSTVLDYYNLGNEAALLIPVLKERAVQDENRRILLRGACAPQNSSQELLRAAHGIPQPQTTPHELLRPASSTETE